MQYGIIFEQRKIFLAEVAFSVNEKSKKRPVLIISNNTFNDKNNEVICCPVTSNPLGSGIVIDTYDLEKGKLLMVSKIKSHHPFFLDKKELYKEIGKLKIDIAFKVAEDIKELIKIDN